MIRIAALLLLFVPDAHTFAMTSSKSSKKDRLRPKTGGGTGFGNKVPTLYHDPCLNDDLQSLLEFLVNKQGAILDDGIQVGISKETGIRGVFCTRAYNKGEIICQIPSDTALALADPSSKEETSLVQAGCNFLEMYALHPDAKVLWAPYLDTLPTLGSDHFDATPDFYDDEELQLLEFPRLIKMAQQRQQELKDLAAQKPALTLEQLQLATWIVSSRALAIPITEQGEQPQVDDLGRPILTKNTRLLRVLVPFIDLVNHASNSPNTELHLIDPEQDNAWFALKATRNIAAGKEIVYSYGNGIESSVELLLNYGFVPHENKVDALMLGKSASSSSGTDCNDTPTTLEAWSTTLDEDELMLQQIDGRGSRLRTILEFRARLKKAIGDLK
jgi:SET domain